MEHTRNQRLSLLQAEKDLEANKPQVLTAKFADISAMEQRCLVLEQKIAPRTFRSQLPDPKLRASFQNTIWTCNSLGKFKFLRSLWREMALSSAFTERLEQVEHTRNQRLSLLQAEKDLQANKSQVLAAKFADIRAMERRCLVLEQKIASQNFQISATRSEIESLVSKYNLDLQQFRVLKSEVDELEELGNEKERLYGLKESEMKEFNTQVERFVLDFRNQVQELRKRLNELKLAFMDPQGKNRYLDNSQIAAAEMRKSELLAEKENLDRSLATNYEIRAQLQKQLQHILIMQNQKRMKLTQFPERSSNSRS